LHQKEAVDAMADVDSVAEAVGVDQSFSHRAVRLVGVAEAQETVAEVVLTLAGLVVEILVAVVLGGIIDINFLI
jgi:hypothetical protein